MADGIAGLLLAIKLYLTWMLRRSSKMEAVSGIDTGLHALVAIARFHQLPAEPDQLSHQFGHEGQSFSDTQLLQAAKVLTLKAKQLASDVSDLSNVMLPAIAKAHDGSYFIVACLSDGEASADFQ
ncbi:cysteine peptidase family C39 domain-containing protein [Microbulbifer sp. TRSA002]|uniref:cysteine peptidase family C39 domain-containing protein n=1 Tax=unclassified Microbulbifer TaxID=2619833 RepID=UPI0024ACF070|nr:cysteine peptidase family C39 domain-containing protein [Microbulbifer sp. VAAF005]WHI45709.1 cysteine peptidase family C39 domain-containing protein [Microbulbifer sp. VAAF005]